MTSTHSASPRSALVRLTRPRLQRLLLSVAERTRHPARLLLVGEGALVAAGLQEWTGRLVYTIGADEPAELDAAIRDAAGRDGVAVERESPADVLPLPSGFEARARTLDGLAGTASSPGLEVL